MHKTISTIVWCLFFGSLDMQLHGMDKRNSDQKDHNTREQNERVVADFLTNLTSEPMVNEYLKTIGVTSNSETDPHLPVPVQRKIAEVLYSSNEKYPLKHTRRSYKYCVHRVCRSQQHTFDNVNALSNHWKTIHKDEKRTLASYTCETCGNLSFNVRVANLHEKKCEQEEPKKRKYTLTNKNPREKPTY